MKMEITYRPASAYTAISSAINDAMERRPCFVRGVEETWEFVYTSTIEELERLIERREIRQAEEVSLPIEIKRPSATTPDLSSGALADGDRSEVIHG